MVASVTYSLLHNNARKFGSLSSRLNNAMKVEAFAIPSLGSWLGWANFALVQILGDENKSVYHACNLAICEKMVSNVTKFRVSRSFGYCLPLDNRVTRLLPVHDIFKVPEGVGILFQVSYYKIYPQLVKIKNLQALAIIGNKFPLDQASGNAVETGFNPVS